MVAGMNTSEQVAYETLREQYDESEITRRSKTQSPDFILPDKAVEVKKLYGDKIIVYTSQVDALEEHETEIWVVDDQEVSDRFPWEEREGVELTVKVADANPGNSSPQRIDDDLEERINEYNANSFSDRVRLALKDAEASTVSKEDIREVVREEVPDLEAEIRETVYDLKEGRI